MPNPFAGTGSGSYGNPFAPAPPSKTKKKKKKLTERQQALLLAAILRAQEGGDSSIADRLKGVGKGTLGAASWALDKIMRPSWAVVAGYSEALKGHEWQKRDLLPTAWALEIGETLATDPSRAKDVLGASWSGLKGETRKGFGEVLEEQGALKGHRRLRGALGFGLDVITDPTMAVSVAAAPFTGGGSLALYATARGAGRAASASLIKKAAREASERVIKGETDDLLGEVLKAGGKQFEHRYGLFKLNKQLAEDTKNVMKMSSDDLAARTREIHAGERMALAESRMYDPRKLQFVIGTARHNIRIPTYIPVISRPGAKLAQREIPVLSGLSDRLGRMFIPGFRNDIYRAGQLARQQAGEFNAVVQRDAAQRIFAGIDEHLSPDEMLDALHYMEQPLKRGRGHWKAVVKNKKTGDFDLNIKYLDQLEADELITPIQRDFIQRYHQVSNFLWNADRSVGLKYHNFNETGRMYVPHVTRPDIDVPNVTMTSLLTKAGFEKGRDATLSLRQIKDYADAGQMADVFEYDPMIAIARRSRAGAERQADMALINTLKASIGAPSRVVDPKRVKAAETRAGAATAKFEGAQRVAAVAEKELEDRIAQVEQELTQVYEAGKLQLGKMSPKIARDLKQQRIKELEDEIARLRKPPKEVPAPKGRAPKAVAPKEAPPPRVESPEFAGFKPHEIKEIKKIAAVRKELDELDARNAPGAELPSWFSTSSRTIKGTRGKSRRTNARAFLDRYEERLLKRRKNRLEWQAKQAAPTPKAPTRAAKPKAEAPARPVKPVTAVNSLRRGKPWHANVMRGNRKVGAVWRDGVGDEVEWVAMRKSGEEIGRFKTRKLAIKAVDDATAPKVAAKAAPKPKAKGKAAPAPAPKKWRPDQKKIKELQAEIERTKKARFTAQARAEAEKGIKELDAKYAAAMDALQRPNSAAAKKILGETQVTFKTAKDALRDARREANNAARALERARRGRPNRKVNERTHYISNELDEYGNKWAFPQEARETILRLERLVSGEDKAVADFARGWGKFMGGWKILMTTVNPGYRLRNTMTDYWNMWVAGVPNVYIGRYSVRAARMMRALKTMDKDPIRWEEAFRTIKEASDHGVMSGLFAGDVQAVAQMFKHAQRSKRYLFKNARFIQLGTKIAQDFNRNAENWGRLTHYLYRREHLKESAAEAAFRVKIAHFDYEDITEFERKLKFTAFPFYTWTRKNIPYQVRQIMARPGRYSAFPKLAQEAEYAAGSEEEGERLPGYVAENFGFRIPFGANQYFMPQQFGISDLAVLEGPEGVENRLRSLLGPQWKIPAELATGRSVFTGQDIAPENHPRVPFSGRGAGLLSRIPGTNVGQTSRPGPGDSMVESPGLDPWAAWALGQVPMARAAFGLGASTPERNRNQLLSYLGGLSTQTVDPQMQAYYDRLRLEESVDKIIAGLRDEGRLPRPDRGKSDFEKTIERILRGDY